MAIRITGLNSGLDTESIITALVSAKQTSVDNLKKERTKLSWKIDAWKELNTKVFNFYSNTLSDLRFNSSYVKKKTTVSDSSILSVVSGDNSVNGVQTASVESVAKAAYLTGGRLQTTDGGTVSTDTKLTDLGVTAGTSFTFTNKGVDTEITIDEDTTVSDLVSKLSEAGVNANFDTTQQRLFVSAKSTGADSDFSFSGDEETLKTLGLVSDGSEYGAVKIDGSNAVLYLNGAKFESSTNTFQINESTYTVSGVSDKNADGSLKEVTITTADDYDGIYDTIRNFIKEYNSLINEMDSLYNADSASGYEPLTSDEKDELSDDEIEEWEDKIKSALLRKDSSLSTVISSMTSAMSSGITVNDQTMYLSSFGISTLGYFDSADNEKHAYHIDGDSDDSATSGNTDVLKSMIASDPDTVKSYFTQLAQNLYSSLTSSMSRVENFKSMYKIYNDQQLDDEMDDYDDEIEEAEEALTEYEDKWYDKFSAMETALAKLSSKESAISSLLSS